MCVHVCEVMCAPARICVHSLPGVHGGRGGAPRDPVARGETRGSAPMLEPRVGCPAGWVGWASPFRASYETSAHKSFGGCCLLGESGWVSWVGLWPLPSLPGGEEGDGKKKPA